MSAKHIEGKKLANDILLNARREIIKHDLQPGLAVFLVGDDPASHLYVKLKEKACKKVGIHFHKYLCDSKMSSTDILDALRFINVDETIDAILIQLPLPEGFDEQEIINHMNPNKDVDGFHPETLKKYLDGTNDFIPGLTTGIWRLIESTGAELKGKTAVIIANSDIFAQPLEKLLQEHGIKAQTVKADDKTLSDKTSQADILVVAIGRPNFIKENMIKQDAIIIDVGTNKVKDGLVGDVDYEDVQDKASFITPVPGGVGPVTVAMLIENTVKLAKQHRSIS